MPLEQGTRGSQRWCDASSEEHRERPSLGSTPENLRLGKRYCPHTLVVAYASIWISGENISWKHDSYSGRYASPTCPGPVLCRVTICARTFGLLAIPESRLPYGKWKRRKSCKFVVPYIRSSLVAWLFASSCYRAADGTSCSSISEEDNLSMKRHSLLIVLDSKTSGEEARRRSLCSSSATTYNRSREWGRDDRGAVQAGRFRGRGRHTTRAVAEAALATVKRLPS